MTTPIAIPAYSTPAALAQLPGPLTASRYALVPGAGVFRWVSGSSETAYGVNYTSASGAGAGQWELVSRLPTFAAESTSDDTQTVLWSLTTDAGKAYAVTVYATIANNTDNHAGALEPRRAVFRNVAGTLAQVGSTLPSSPADILDASISAVAVAFGTSGQAIRFLGTGVSGKSLAWVLRIDVDEVAIS